MKTAFSYNVKHEMVAPPQIFYSYKTVSPEINASFNRALIKAIRRPEFMMSAYT